MNPVQQKQNPAGGPGFDEQQIELALVEAPTSYHQRPAPGTIRANVLEALESGRCLTSLEAWRDLGTSRLAADVHTLRKYGWPIVTEEIDVAARGGRAARVAQYRLTEVAS